MNQEEQYARAELMTRADMLANLIDMIDAMADDPDLEDSDEDRCSARDDEPRASYHADQGPGDPDDAEAEP